MEKFTATELVEHYAIDKSGERKGPDKRKFEYVVVVRRDRTGAFWLEEYRNGSTDHEQFPAHLATLGLPAIDRKSTRLKLQSRLHLVCRLLLEKKKKKEN